jgi:hypothetical protein
MFTLAAITATLFGLGWLSAYGTILSRDGAAFPLVLRMLIGAAALFFAIVAFCFITSSGHGLLLAEFSVLNLGQTAGLVLCGKTKNS